MKNLESINSVCTTAEELIKSEDFIKGIGIILEQTKTFNKEYILGIFAKLQKRETLDEEEKQDLKSFMTNKKVEEKGQKLLSKMKNVSVDVKTNDIEELSSFSELLNEIFSENGYKKIQGIVLKVSGEVSENLEEKEENLKKYKEFGKLNERDIEILEEIEKEEPELFEKLKGKIEFREETIVMEGLEWDREDLEVNGKKYLYRETAVKEAKKLGKRLITKKEFEKLLKLFNGKKEYLGNILNIKQGYYWTSTMYEYIIDSLYLIIFNHNSSASSDKSGNYYVRCVR